MSEFTTDQLDRMYEGVNSTVEELEGSIKVSLKLQRVADTLKDTNAGTAIQELVLEDRKRLKRMRTILLFLETIMKDTPA